MKAIYASKLYRASNRKDKIEAAIADPVNLELVTQLKSYLDEEYQDVVNRHEAKEKAQLVEGLIDEHQGADNISHSSDSNSSSSPSSGGFGGSPGGGPSLSEKFDMLVSGDDNDESPDDIPSDVDEASSDLDDISDDSGLDDIEESTAIEGVVEPTIDSPSDISNDVKALLNSDESTQGINRALVKKNELWVHYNDDINLNNIMGPVIEKLNVEGYQDIDFNRLARSENAIVFQINSVSVKEDVDGV